MVEYLVVWSICRTREGLEDLAHEVATLQEEKVFPK